MRAPATVLFFFACIICNPSYSQFRDEADLHETGIASTAEQQSKLNFFVVSKRKKGALDLASRFNVFRAKMKSVFRHKKFVAIVARNAQHACNKIEFRLNKYNARIGTLWFDSHGMYKKGYSLFFIGHDEISYKTLKDSCTVIPFQKLAVYSDTQTNLVIGSCYGGATYTRASIDYKDTTRMNGDSLMIALGKIIRQGNVYASESWVMTKPGLFLKREAVAGFPGRNLFRDICYQPAWENAGKWNAYNIGTGSFRAVNPVTLDMYGNVLLRSTPYQDRDEVCKDISKNIKKLEPGLYK
jgi:hypothetical protein